MNKKTSNLSDALASEGRVKGDGIFVSASKSIDKFNLGLQYILVKGGMDIGNTFEIGIITFGDDESSDTLTSTATKNSSVLALPIQYQINDKLELSTAFLFGKNQDKSFNEIDLALNYQLNENMNFDISYAVRDKYKSKKETYISAGLIVNWSI